ncbi:uncharacterized protein LOC141851916 [Brevipalpus obovatus]|uniref:uncharacterized protein LOC141851916 n=1 Tax=Brevipalpus obovatus TaxID=246614 RepID=UPI003D9DC84B
MKKIVGKLQSYFTGQFLDQMLFIVSLIFCGMQIYSLTIDYLRYDVMESVSQQIQLFIEPPNFSLCFRILSIIDSEAIIDAHPNIRYYVEKFSRERGLGDWNRTSILNGNSIGPEIIYHHLTVAQIYQYVPPFNRSLEGCQYLNSTLHMSKCDGTFFREYFFNRAFCYEFTWFPHEKNLERAYRFPFDGIKVPGFQNARFLALYLNVTHLPFLTGISVSAHPPGQISWDPEAHTFEIGIEDYEMKASGITYHKTTRQSLPHPYRSNCSDYSGSKFRSRQDCLQKCSVDRFIKRFGYYPRYAVVRHFDHYRLLYHSSVREKYQSFILELSKRCNHFCGNEECISQEYRLTQMYNPKQKNFLGKTVIIHIYPPTQPDSLVQTVPRLTFQYYFASVGGTIGLWLGMSFYSLFTQMLHFAPLIWKKIK